MTDLPEGYSVRVVAVTKPVVSDAAAVARLHDKDLGAPPALRNSSYPSEAIITYCARVSNPSNQSNHETGPRLLRYLRKHGHWSPFEMAHAVIEIECPRDIARQILRHRSFSFQEFSQRYAAALHRARREARRQDHTNRQASHDDLPRWKRAVWALTSRAVAVAAAVAYSTALRMDIAKETARTVLPEGQTMSRLYMAGSVRSWLHYVQLRTGIETQREHRAVALAVREELTRHYPQTFDPDYPSPSPAAPRNGGKNDT